MSIRRDDVLHELLPENARRLAMVCPVLLGITAVAVPGAAQRLAWLDAGAFSAGFLIVLRGLTLNFWPESEVRIQPYSDDVVPLRPAPYNSPA